MYFSVFFMFVYAVGHEGINAALRVHGPSDPLVAQLGGSVLLPCFIESTLPLEELQVEWRKMGTGSVVSLFQQGKSRPDRQTQVFRDRAGFFQDEVSKGNFSILLKNVIKEDAGVYRCEVNTTQNTGKVIMEMKEIKHFVVTGADHAVFAHKGEDVILNCSVDTHLPASEIEEVTWKKTDQDILVLLYQDSKIFTDSSHESYRGRVNLFSSEIPKGNFSIQLKDVKMEDKGEFTCEVFTRNMSASTTVVLHGVGFSAVHILILVFCLTALLLAVGFCGPVFNLLRKEVTTKKAMIIHISLILCPNIFMFVAFCLWSTEGFVAEVITCSTVSIMRLIVLIKTSLYINKFPQIVQKVVKDLAVPLYHSSLILGACSYFFNGQIQTTPQRFNALLTALAVLFVIGAFLTAVYGFLMHLTMCLEILNAIVLALSINFGPNLNYENEISLLLPTLTAGIVIVLSLQRHFFLGKPFGCVHITFSSLLMSAFSLYEISFYIFLVVTLNSFVIGWKCLFQVVLFIFAWLSAIYLLRCLHGHVHGCCSQWKKIGYLCCAIVAAFLFTTYSMMSFRYAYIVLQIKEPAGFLALMPVLHVLPAICLFKHPKHLPEVFHIMVYMFGSVGLSTVNAIVLATELILKAGKGARTIEDLRVIVLPLETVFLFAWLTLQIYDAWMRYKDGALYLYEDTRKTGPEEAMNALQENIPSPD